MATTSEASPPGFPLLICGLPRAGTSFLHSTLAGHDYFRNDNFADKELRYFQNFLGRRPWGHIDAVSQLRFAGIDELIVPHIVRRLHELLREIRGGPHGHYLIANPDDIFYSEYLTAAIPEARFIISIRDPLTNIWSMLNYPQHSWGKRDESGFFKETDVRNRAEHWDKVARHILDYKLAARREQFFILEQEALVKADPGYHLEIERFLGVPRIAKMFDARAGMVVHSTFLQERDAKFENTEHKLKHFRNIELVVANEPHFAEIVMSICRPRIIGLQKLGFLQHGPSAALVSAAVPSDQPRDTV